MLRHFLCVWSGSEAGTRARGPPPAGAARSVPMHLASRGLEMPEDARRCHVPASEWPPQLHPALPAARTEGHERPSGPVGQSPCRGGRSARGGCGRKGGLRRTVFAAPLLVRHYSKTKALRRRCARKPRHGGTQGGPEAGCRVLAGKPAALCLSWWLPGWEGATGRGGA